jgi:hypothetical protein
MSGEFSLHDVSHPTETIWAHTDHGNYAALSIRYNQPPAQGLGPFPRNPPGQPVFDWLQR